jgi:HD-like signal output (HDOD) protein
LTTALASNPAAVEAFLKEYQMIQAMPDSAMQVMRLTADPKCDSARLGKLIEKDAALVAAIMKTVNSAFYSLPAKMTRLDRALDYLGMKTVKEIVATTCLSKLCSATSLGTYSVRDLWDHSVVTGIVARELAIRSNQLDSEECFLAGILIDIGLILTAQSDVKRGADLLTQAESATVPFADLELQLFEFTHADLGASLAKKWKMPESHATVIQFHHHPDDAPEPYRTVASHLFIADSLAAQNKVGCPLTARQQTPGDSHLDAAGVTREMIDEVVKKLPLLIRLHLH